MFESDSQFGYPWRAATGTHFEKQRDRAPATLVERRAQPIRLVQLLRLSEVQQHLPRFAGSRVLEISAADAAKGRIRSNNHATSGLTRRRTENQVQGDQHTRLLLEHAVEGEGPVHGGV